MKKIILLLTLSFTLSFFSNGAEQILKQLSLDEGNWTTVHSFISKFRFK